MSIISSLLSASGALDAFSQVLDVTSNNVANASTPGYAALTQTLEAMPFESTMGNIGGVRASSVETTRNQYAEQSVQQQTTQFGQAQQNVNSLTSIQSVLDVADGSGLSSALNSLFQSFSSWAQSPTSTVARQSVIDNASEVASAFQQAASGLSQVSQDTGQQLQQTVDDVNSLEKQLADYNGRIIAGDKNDAGLDAEVYSTLEQLSQYVDFSATPQTDGSVSVLLNGQTPLVIGAQAYQLSVEPVAPDSTAAYPNAPATQRLLAYDGKDVTTATTGGQLGALLNLTNSVLPSYLGSATQPGDLNTLAKDFASRINGLLTQGNISDGSDGNPATPGVALFVYNTANDTNVAQSLQVNPNITAGQLAAIQMGPPEVSNGVALALAQLADPQDTNDEIGGASYTEYYGAMAACVGTQLSKAQNQLQVQQTAVAQAQTLRQQLSGVSLDDEATMLIQFQRAYEANSKLITILDQLTEDTINMLTT